MFEKLKTRVRNKVVTLVERTLNERLSAYEARFAVLQQELAEQRTRCAALDERCRQEVKAVDYHNLTAYEAAVNLALRDLCRPGDVCFDVGAHAGYLTMLMARLIGPAGHVCAFEANSHNIQFCRQNLTQNGCYNSTLIQRAVYKCSNEQMRFYAPASAGESQVGSLYGSGNEFQTVTTVALDDFIAASKLQPRIIKMDIEGAEHDALLGCREYLERGRPHLILEQMVNDGNACLDLLQQLGYAVLDLSNYRSVRSCADYPRDSVVRNVLCIHRERLGETPYRAPMKFVPTVGVTAEQFQSQDDGHAVWKHYRFQANPGRYALEVDYDAEGEKSYMELKAFVNQENRVYFGGSPRWIWLSYRDFIVDVDKAGEVHVQFMLPHYAPDPTFRLKGLTCAQVVDFPRHAHFEFS